MTVFACEVVLTSSEFVEKYSVSRETIVRYEALIELLISWNKRINLVGRNTLDDPWRRHIEDSYQIKPHIPSTSQTIVDLGSGAGFPALVAASVTNANWHLIESDKRKAAFLRQAVIQMDLQNVTIHTNRIQETKIIADVITARAYAPLNELIKSVSRIATSSTQYILLKGRSVTSELTPADNHWNMTVRRVQSVVDPEGSILILNQVTSKNDEH